MTYTKLCLTGMIITGGFLATSTALAVEGNQAAITTSNGTITLKEYTDATNPENGGPLRIDNVTNITFGDQLISGDDQVYSADFKAEVDASGKRLPDSIRVIDDRGSNKGWELQVKNNGFTSVDGALPLNGTELTFNTVSASSKSSNVLPSDLKKAVLKNDGFKSIVKAKQGEGVGTTTHLFGTSSADIVAENSDVTLKIPGNSTKMKDMTYQTTITWLLLDDPATLLAP